MKTDISVIIPAYNEESTVAGVVETVVSWGKAQEVFVVNDGSTDTTGEALKHFNSHIQVITLSKNRGKAYAVSEAIRRSGGKVVMLIDADLVGLTHSDLELMLKPMSDGKAEMVVAVPKVTGSLGNHKIYHQISGERVFRRIDILPYINEMRDIGYGLEVFLNHIYRHRRVFYFKFPFVIMLKQWQKRDLLSSLVIYIKQIRDIAVELVRQIAGQALRSGVRGQLAPAEEAG